ncbi:MAG TPA: response regulator transcription factor [Pseudomonadota bacterium]|nr:response regulator transcription factor [Pseudomonadota bacterium]
MRLLLIEDDVRLVRTLVAGLQEELFVVDVHHDGDNGLRALVANLYDVCVLDVNLPGRDGFAVLTAARQAGICTPLLLLTARDDLADRVRGLNQGADDYLVKPFAFAELLARVRALLRRGGPRTPGPGDVLRLGEVELHVAAHEVRVAGCLVDMTPKQFALLEHLIRHAGEVVTRSMLLSSVWGYSFDPGTNLVDVHIAQLRRKLEQAGAEGFIRTLRGVGYRVDEQDHR